MRTDSFFYRFFSEYPEAFFAIIGRDVRKVANYQFKSVEVKEIAFRFDGIFPPNSKDDTIFFFEVQFTKKSSFYLHFFGENATYLKRYQPPQSWRAGVLFPEQAIDPGVEPHYREFFESGRLRRVYLAIP